MFEISCGLASLARAAIARAAAPTIAGCASIWAPSKGRGYRRHDLVQSNMLGY